MLSKERISRIEQMEKILNEGNELFDKLAQIHARWQAYQANYHMLINYYENEWRDDYDAHNAGEIPADIKCGVLSQDAVYDLISTQRNECLNSLKNIVEILDKS